MHIVWLLDKSPNSSLAVRSFDESLGSTRSVHMGVNFNL
jgi:hypothetical protein